MSGALPERWEHGSEFQLLSPEADATRRAEPWQQHGTFWGSGRDALRALMRHGAGTRGWRRLWVPTYFCQDVVADMQQESLQLAFYPCNPLDDMAPSGAEAGDAVLVVNYFGLRGDARRYDFPAGIEVIEDHSHDPGSVWASESTADWCVASLRKTLPIPVGAALWSPRNHPPPPLAVPSATRVEAALHKTAGMLLKARYLQGGAVDKPLFRELLQAGEDGIARGDISTLPPWVMPLLNDCAINEWRLRRKDNHVFAAGLFGARPDIVVLSARDSAAVPLSLVLLADSRTLRDGLRQHLIGNNVYPAVLWTLDASLSRSITDADRRFAGRMLSLHCDMRYTHTDMQRVVDVVNEYLDMAA